MRLKICLHSHDIMTHVRCIEEVYACLQQDDIEKSKQLFSKLSCELHSREFKFLGFHELISKGLCRCHAVEWCVPESMKGQFAPIR